MLASNGPKWGARLLIWGGPGVGKDAMTASLVRSEPFTTCPAFELQYWIQASNNEMFCRQLCQVHHICTFILSVLFLTLVWLGLLYVTVFCGIESVLH